MVTTIAAEVTASCCWHWCSAYTPRSSGFQGTAEQSRQALSRMCLCTDNIQTTATTGATVQPPTQKTGTNTATATTTTTTHLKTRPRKPKGPNLDTKGKIIQEGFQNSRTVAHERPRRMQSRHKHQQKITNNNGTLLRRHHDNEHNNNTFEVNHDVRRSPSRRVIAEDPLATTATRRRHVLSVPLCGFLRRLAFHLSPNMCLFLSIKHRRADSEFKD